MFKPLVENQFRMPDIREQMQKVDDGKRKTDIEAVNIEKMTFALTRVLNT